MATGGLVRLLASATALLSLIAARADEATHRLTLAEPTMAASAEGRVLLKYLVSCALDAQTSLTTTADGQSYEFTGDLGLAPHWVDRAMTESEQRWVSACMLARINRLGVSVRISMRSAFPSRYRRLAVSREEAERFPSREATFFGNLFAEAPVSFVCGPPLTAAMRARLESQHRLCSLPGDGDLTACGMRHVGPCSPAAFRQQGVNYREAISVYLPSGSPAAK